MKRNLVGAGGTFSTWRIVGVALAIGLTLSLLPIAADATSNLVTISSSDDSSQAGVEDGRLLVSPFGAGGGAGAVVGGLLTPANPVRVLLVTPGNAGPVVTSAFGVATPTATTDSYIRFAFVHRGSSGDPSCKSPPGTLASAGDITNMWVPTRGQAQMEFPIIGAAAGKGGIQTCLVAYLLSGGPVNAWVSGPFD